MKKIIIFVLSFLMILNLGLVGCGGDQQGGGADSSEVTYEDALAVMTAVFEAYQEDELFAIYGGDQENAVMDAPGRFDVSKTDELVYTLNLPESQISSIDDAASMVHMMNANTFTGAVYHLTEGTDPDAFAEEVKAGLLETQWMCGFPDTMAIINAGGGYIVVAYGEAEIMKIFQAKALSALSGAEVMIEAPFA